MAAWTHYFTFKATDEFAGHWVEIVCSSNKKAEQKMEEMYGRTWDHHYTEFNAFMDYKKYPLGRLAYYEVE